MLYRSNGPILFVQSGGPVLSRLRPVRDRRPDRESPKPSPRTREAAVPDPIRTAEPPIRVVNEPVRPPRDLVARLARWRRVSSWWCFPAEELERLLARP